MDMKRVRNFRSEIRKEAVYGTFSKTEDLAFVESSDDAGHWEQKGINYLAYFVDVGIFYSACAEIVAKLHANSTVPLITK